MYLKRFWINKDTHLDGESVILIPLEKNHFPELADIASDKRIWEFYIFDGSNLEKISNALDRALTEKERGRQLPFVIIHKDTGRIIGSTRFLDIQPEHKKLEIGWTWLIPEFWGTEVNAECKLLLLSHCFEKLDACKGSV